MRTIAVLVLMLTGAISVAAVSVGAERSYEFSVLLDGSPIGYHHFDLLPGESGLEVRSEASFDVRFLFINAFRYRHTNRELWDGECLRLIESSTRQNGEEFVVSGERVSESLEIEANGKSDRLDGCVMSFVLEPEIPQSIAAARSADGRVPARGRAASGARAADDPWRARAGVSLPTQGT